MWGSTKGLFLDKGFNLKISYKPKKYYLPKLAIGLDDFSGTGVFTKEYIVSTYSLNRIKLSAGIGWGKFVGQENSFTNPLTKLSDRFEKRSIVSKNFNFGGSPSYDKWFRGDSVFFGGLEVPFGKKKNFSFKLESNPFDYYKFGCCGEGLSAESYILRNSKKNFNYGLSYALKNYGNIDLSFIKGDTLNLSISFGLSTKKPITKKKKFLPIITNNNFNEANKKNEFYLDLLNNLNANKLFLQTANLEEDSLSISVDSFELNNPVQYASRSAYIANEVLKFNNYDLNTIDVGLIKRGIEINNIRFDSSDLDNEKYQKAIVKLNSKVSNVDPILYKKDEFRPKVNFPVIYNTIEPEVRSHVGSPERFLFWGLGVKLRSEIQINRNITVSSNLVQNLTDKFGEKVSSPSSKLEHVRTEIVDYLQQSDDLYIKNLHVDYISSLNKNFYGRLTVGLFEEMYGGISSEILFKPFLRNFSIGYEANKVRKRDYDSKFNFLEFKQTTQHFNFAYYHPHSNILAKYSYGKYLAGDRGYTLDLSRRMPSGWQAGFYFSRTNVSADMFGEGSFDKGFYFKIPFNLIEKNYSKNFVDFGLKTMTRDGGQKLVIENKLIDSFYGSSRTEINENWDNYLD